MYAVIKTGGKQYRVVEDQEIVVESLDKKPGEKVLFGEVLLIKKEDKILARPDDLKGAKVEGVVVEHLRGEKIEGFKYRPKKRQRKRFGHRQELTKVKIVKISLPGERMEEKPEVKRADLKEGKKAKEVKEKPKKAVAKKAVTYSASADKPRVELEEKERAKKAKSGKKTRAGTTKTTRKSSSSSSK